VSESTERTTALTGTRAAKRKQKIYKIRFMVLPSANTIRVEWEGHVAKCTVLAISK
jgi:hypothetical protein